MLPTPMPPTTCPTTPFFPYLLSWQTPAKPNNSNGSNVVVIYDRPDHFTGSLHPLSYYNGVDRTVNIILDLSQERLQRTSNPFELAMAVGCQCNSWLFAGTVNLKVSIPFMNGFWASLNEATFTRFTIWVWRINNDWPTTTTRSCDDINNN